MTTAFGIPHAGNNFVFPYINSLMGLIFHETQKPPSERLLGSVLPAGGPYVDDNRGSISINLCEQTQDDWVLMVDPDIEFQPNILDIHKKLTVDYPDAKIISGRVNLLNGLPVFYYKGKNRTYNSHYAYPFDGLREFPLVGTGIIFIHRDVFVKLRHDCGHHHFFHRIMNDEGLLNGDDFSFCIRATKSGFRVYGAWDIVGIHHKIYPCPSRYLEKDQVQVKIGLG